MEYDRRQEALWRETLKLWQTSTCGYNTLIPKVSGIFLLCFLSAVLFHALQVLGSPILAQSQGSLLEAPSQLPVDLEM